MEQLLLILISITFCFSLYGFVKVAKSKKVSSRTWVFGILAILLIPFGLAWCITSFAEREPNAGYMGIAFFSGLGFILGILSYQGFHTAKQETKADLKAPSPVKVLVVATLLVVGAGLLPLALALNRLASITSDPDQMISLFSTHVVSDRSLPFTIKKALAYETLYGIYPGTLEARLMQSMFSGVKEKEMIRLLAQVFPGRERQDLLHESLQAGYSWLESSEPYPKLTLTPGQYLQKVDQKAEFIVEWIYQNFDLPPMDSLAAAQFSTGNASNEFGDYMVTPPDSLKTAIIAPAANALRLQLSKAQIPSTLDVPEELQSQWTVEKAHSVKKTIRLAFGLAKWSWLLPAFLIILGIFLMMRFKLPLLPWTALSLLILGVLGFMITHPLRDVDGTVHDLVTSIGENAPAPALAVVFQVVPQLLISLSKFITPFISVFTLAGVFLLLYTYGEKVIDSIYFLVNRVRHAIFRDQKHAS